MLVRFCFMDILSVLQYVWCYPYVASGCLGLGLLKFACISDRVVQAVATDEIDPDGDILRLVFLIPCLIAVSRTTFVTDQLRYKRFFFVSAT